jgi:hypothetical protein
MVTQTLDGKVLFQFYRPDVRQVTVAGDFNGWQNSFHMSRGHDGWWRCQIELAPGTYRFRYLADGQWHTDYAAFGVEPGPYGWNSVLLVQPAVKVVETGSGDEQLEVAAEQMAPSLVEEGSLTPPPRRPVRQKPERQPEPVAVRRIVVSRRPVMAG